MKSNLPHVNPALCNNAACMECGETLPQKSQVLGTASSVWMAGARHLPVLGGGGGYVLICEWAHAWAHVWRPGDKPAVLPRGCSTLNFERGSHWPGYHQPVQVGGLAQESQKSSCLCLPNSETISVHQNSQTLVCALRSWLHIGSKSDVSK